MNKNANNFIKTILPTLKSSGFIKSGQTWRKQNIESIAVFNVQKSQWDTEAFHVNIGLYYKSLGNDILPTENKCHVQTRVDTDDWNLVVPFSIHWFSKREALSSAKLLADEDSKKGLVFKELRIVNYH